MDIGMYLGMYFLISSVMLATQIKPRVCHCSRSCQVDCQVICHSQGVELVVVCEVREGQGCCLS